MAVWWHDAPGTCVELAALDLLACVHALQTLQTPAAPCPALFPTVEETSNAMGLDGIMFEGVSVRVRRPNDYNPAAAVGLGPSGPNANLNLMAIGLGGGMGGGGGMGVMASTGPDANERIFVGGLPYYLTDEQCKELLGSFGAIKSFDLVKDRETGTSKG